MKLRSKCSVFSSVKRSHGKKIEIFIKGLSFESDFLKENELGNLVLGT